MRLSVSKTRYSVGASRRGGRDAIPPGSPDRNGRGFPSIWHRTGRADFPHPALRLDSSHVIWQFGPRQRIFLQTTLRSRLHAVAGHVARSHAQSITVTTGRHWNVWSAFLRKLARRGLRGGKLVISMPTKASRPVRNVLEHAGRQGRRVVSAFIATAFAQDGAEAARAQGRRVADQLRPKMPKLAPFHGRRRG